MQMVRHGAPLPPDPLPVATTVHKNATDAKLSLENSFHAEEVADNMPKIRMQDGGSESESEGGRTTRASTTDSLMYM